MIVHDFRLANSYDTLVLLKEKDPIQIAVVIFLQKQPLLKRHVKCGVDVRNVTYY